MYKCVECENIFEKPKEWSEDYTPGGANEGGSFIYRYDGCPSCGGAFREAKVCDACLKYEIEERGEYIDNDWLCNDCLDKLEEV